MGEKKQNQHPGIALKRLFSGKGILSMNLKTDTTEKKQIKPPMRDWEIKNHLRSYSQYNCRCFSSNKAGSFNTLLGCYITFSYKFSFIRSPQKNPSSNNLIFPS